MPAAIVAERRKREKQMWMRIVALGFLLACFATGQEPIPIILDTDIGGDIDDALALALALQSPELDVRAVTTVSDDTEGRARLAWKELGLYGRQDIPVAAGAVETLIRTRNESRTPAQFQLLTPQDTLPTSGRRRATDVIIETLLTSPRKMTIVPIGPLTNIALALKTEPRIKQKIERIVLMGGAFDLLIPEYNIRRDYLAASIVFNSGVPITAVGLDVTQLCKLQGADLDRLRQADHPAGQLLFRLIELWRGGHQDRYPTLHDPLAVAVSFLPNLVELQLGQVDVETTGSNATQGLTVFTPAKDPPGRYMPLPLGPHQTWRNAEYTVLAAKQVKVRDFLELFVKRLTAPPRRKGEAAD
jgi:inosine-uridine nucleoside N-ribohydrolase